MAVFQYDIHGRQKAPVIQAVLRLISETFAIKLHYFEDKVKHEFVFFRQYTSPCCRLGATIL